MSSRRSVHRRNVPILIAGIALAAVSVRADGPGRSFTALDPSFTQELFGVTAVPVTVDGADGFLGGVAFAPDGDVWAAECEASHYHRYDREAPVPDGHGGTVHAESLVDLSTYEPAPLGCGVVNVPGGYLGIDAMFANTLSGLWPMESATGAPILGGPLNSAILHAGNGRGIDVDPAAALPHVVYAGADCDPSLRAASACTLWDYELVSGATLAFARFHRAPGESIESLYFAPDGARLFASYRNTDSGTQGLLVIARPEALLGRTTIDDAQVTGRIEMAAMPQGLAFRAAGDFAVTQNENGTMTRLTFPRAGFAGDPAQSAFAAGGFRGGLSRVGGDGCLYAPQGRAEGGTSGVRFGDDAVAPRESVVRVCGGFVPAPGLDAGAWPPEPGSISGSAFADWNRNGARDAGEPGLSGIAIAVSGSDVGSTTTDAGGAYTVSGLAAGWYSVSAPAVVGALSGNPTPLSVELTAGQHQHGVSFPYSESVPPVCTSSVQSGSPSRIVFTLRDATSGVRRVSVRSLANAQLSIAGRPTITIPGTIDLGLPVAGDLLLTATPINQSQAASVSLEVEDAFGAVAACAATLPGVAPPPPPPSGSIQRTLTSGRRGVDVDLVRHVPGTATLVTVKNGRRGLRHVTVRVNQRWFHVGPLRDNEVKTIDVSKALVSGTKNRIVLVGWGKPSESAVVIISDRKAEPKEKKTKKARR